jgi:hypothetical protein
MIGRHACRDRRETDASPSHGIGRRVSPEACPRNALATSERARLLRNVQEANRQRRDLPVADDA